MSQPNPHWKGLTCRVPARRKCDDMPGGGTGSSRNSTPPRLWWPFPGPLPPCTVHHCIPDGLSLRTLKHVPQAMHPSILLCYDPCCILSHAVGWVSWHARAVPNHALKTSRTGECPQDRPVGAACKPLYYLQLYENRPHHNDSKLWAVHHTVGDLPEYLVSSCPHEHQSSMTFASTTKAPAERMLKYKRISKSRGEISISCE